MRSARLIRISAALSADVGPSSRKTTNSLFASVKVLQAVVSVAYAAFRSAASSDGRVLSAKLPMLTPWPLPSVRSRRRDATVSTCLVAVGLPGQASAAFPAEGTFLGSTHGLPRSAGPTIARFSAAASAALSGADGDGLGVGVVLTGELGLVAGVLSA